MEPIDQGYPEINNLKKQKTQATNIWENLVEIRSKKREGSTAGLSPRFYDQLWYKCYIKYENGSILSSKTIFLKPVGPNGTVITMVQGRVKEAPPFTGTFWSLCGRKWRPEGAFWKSWKSKMAPQTIIFLKLGTATFQNGPQERFGKNIKKQ